MGRLDGKQFPSLRRRVICAAVASCFAVPVVQANPTGAQVANGQASFNQQGGILSITNSPGAIINWQSFSIGVNETTRFIQQSAASSVLNRVIGQDPSAILGTLQSNGRVFLINPNGILFGQGAQINVAGLVASTLNLSDQDFLANRLNFTANPLAKGIQNQGAITTASGGNVYLVAPDVQNSGIITTPQGEVVLAAGKSVQLVDAGTPDLRVEITAPGDQVVNVGQIVSSGGRINLYGALVSQKGIVNASSAVAAGGRIFLKATQKIELAEGSKAAADGAQGGEIVAKVEDGGQIGGTLVARGELSAQGDGTKGSGGFVETSAGRVDLNGVSVKTRGGRWLIDPNDFTIAATGGDITGAQLSSNLNGTDIAIESTQGTHSGTTGNGDINVNDAVTWNTYSLILTAERDININAVMKANNASLVMSTGVVGGVVGAASGTVKVGFAADGSFKGRVDFFLADGTTPGTDTGYLGINNERYTVITDLNALQAMSGNLTGHYALGADIDASATSGWNSGAGFVPIGNPTTKFSGNFDGLGHSIRDLTINRPAESNVGLFGNVQDLFGAPRSAVRNVGLAHASVVGADIVGGLVGKNDGNLIGNSYVTGSVTGTSNVGGLVGISYRPISNSYATGTVTGTGDFVGGLVGSNGGVISNSYASGAVVTGSSYVGGLVGNPGGLSTSSNVHYNIDTAGLGMVAAGGLYGTQFQDWVGGNLAPLDIAHYYTANAAGFYQIADTQGLKNLLGFADTANPAYKFVLTANLDLATLPGYNIPLFAAPQLDGGGHALANFTLTVPNNDGVGFIGKLNAGSTVNNLGLTNVDVTGSANVGGLVGGNYGTVSNSYATGKVTGGSYSTDVGGLVGHNFSTGTIDGSYATVIVNVGASSQRVGGLVGWNEGGITNSHATGAVSGQDNSQDIGGLVGQNYYGSVSGSYATGAVIAGAASAYIGGLVGENLGSISGSHATGTVSGGVLSDSVGGLAGYSEGSISDSYASGTVSGGAGSTSIGGLVGWNMGSIQSSYAIGAVSGGDGSSGVGGLVGDNDGDVGGSYATGAVSGGLNSGDIGGLAGSNTWYVTGSYATGTVSGGDNSGTIGGLVGYNYGSIDGSYSTGRVTGGSGSTDVSGLVGLNDFGTVTNSFWDMETSGQTSSSGGMGLTTAQMNQSANFAGWDFTNTWRQYDGYTRPLLKSFLTPLTLTAGATKIDDGQAYSGGAYTGSASFNPANIFGTAVYGGTAQGAVNPGSYTLTLDGHGLYSNQQGYDLSFADGTLTITTAAPPAASSAIVNAINMVKPADTQNTTQISLAPPTSLVPTEDAPSSNSPSTAAETSSGTESGSSGSTSTTTKGTSQESKTGGAAKGDDKIDKKKPQTCS